MKESVFFIWWEGHDWVSSFYYYKKWNVLLQIKTLKKKVTSEKGSEKA